MAAPPSHMYTCREEYVMDLGRAVTITDRTYVDAVSLQIGVHISEKGKAPGEPEHQVTWIIKIFDYTEQEGQRNLALAKSILDSMKTQSQRELGYLCGKERGEWQRYDEGW